MGYNIEKQKKTQRQIAEAYISIYEANPYAKITVSQVCKKAGVHRSTFYLHYDNIGFMLREIEDSIFEEIEKYFIKIHLMDFDKIRREYLEGTDLDEIKDFYFQNKHLLRTLLAPYGSSCFFNKLKKGIVECFEWILYRSKLDMGPRQEYILSSMATGIIDILYNWLKDEDMEIEEIAKIIIKIFTQNPFLNQ